MSKFDEYFLMQSIDAINFAREKLDFFSKDADLQCDEIGDGSDFEVVFLCEFDKVGQPRHGAVVIHDLADDA